MWERWNVASSDKVRPVLCGVCLQQISDNFKKTLELFGKDCGYYVVRKQWQSVFAKLRFTLVERLPKIHLTSHIRQAVISLLQEHIVANE